MAKLNNKTITPRKKGYKVPFKERPNAKGRVGWRRGKTFEYKARPKAKGRNVWNKGKKETRKEVIEKMKKIVRKSGKDHPSWKGGITALRQQIQNNFKYRQWRCDVFTRDDYRCQKCKIRSSVGIRVTLQAHHLNPFYIIIKENNIKNLEDAIKCDELWNINNGETLCEDCHKDTDTYLSKIKNYEKK